MESVHERTDSLAFMIEISSQLSKHRIQAIVDKAKDLNREESELLVDVLGMTLKENPRSLESLECILLLLTKLASSVRIFARNRTISPKHIIVVQEDIIEGPDKLMPIFLLLTKIASLASRFTQNRIINKQRVANSQEHSPDVDTIQGEPPVQVRVIKQGAEVFNEDLVTWAHLSHPNILPIYAAFLGGPEGPVSLVSPQMTKGGNVAEHAKTLSQKERMPLISDIIDGLCYLHRLNVVHGRLSPENVSISQYGRALITGLNASPGTQVCEVRYSAPEILQQLEDGLRPTKAADMWSLGCIAYEVLSGKVPYFHLRRERQVVFSIFNGIQPIPASGTFDGGGIGGKNLNAILRCWKFVAEDRPTCWELQGVFASIMEHDGRSVPKPTVQPEAFVHKRSPALNFDLANSILTRIISSALSMPQPPRVPLPLRDLVLELANDLLTSETPVLAEQKLSPDEIQTFVDVLDMIIGENSALAYPQTPVMKLLSRTMDSTFIFPQRYKIDRILRDPIPIAEGDFGKVYKGRDVEVSVSMITRRNDVSNVIDYLTLCTHLSHPNIFPLLGVFHEDINKIPRFCVVSPYMKNGVLCDYAPRLAQRDRLPLVSDIIAALVHLERLNIRHDDVSGDMILISDEGRALITAFGTGEIFAAPAKNGFTRKSGPYALRFYSPERVRNHDLGHAGSVWSFGCLLYEVLSQKVPYHQYTEESDVRAALYRGEPLRRPNEAIDACDAIDDNFWALITNCCMLFPNDRFTASKIRDQLTTMTILDDHLPDRSSAGHLTLKLRLTSKTDWDCAKRVLDQILLMHLQSPLSTLITNSTWKVAAAAGNLQLKDLQSFVDYIDLALDRHPNFSKRPELLALLSDISVHEYQFDAFDPDYSIYPDDISTDPFHPRPVPWRPYPRRLKLERIPYGSSSVAEGGNAPVHKGLYDPHLCIKVMNTAEAECLRACGRELIHWAHSCHLNVLPFYGVFFDKHHICLVSPFMKNGTLYEYKYRVSVQKERFPLLNDVIKGLNYLHGQGIVHGDLKGKNVLISCDGRGLIADFGTSRVIATTAQPPAAIKAHQYNIRFVAPEIIREGGSQPTKDSDIWSFGCLCYEVLSRQSPYFQYKDNEQATREIRSGKGPERPCVTHNSDLDEIHDPAWELITKCCSPKTRERPKASEVQDMIVRLRIIDTRPEEQHIYDTGVLKYRMNFDVNLCGVVKLLDGIQSNLRKMTECA